MEYFLKSNFAGIPQVQRTHGQVLDLETIERIQDTGTKITNEDIVAYNRTVTTTTNIYLLEKMFPQHKFKNEYDKNKTQFDFNYTLYTDDEIDEVRIYFNSKTNLFEVSSNNTTTQNETDNIETKLSNGLKNLSIFINSVKYDGIELKIDIPDNKKYNPVILETWKPVTTNNNTEEEIENGFSETYLYNEEHVFGKIYSEDIFVNPELYLVKSVINFDEPDMEYEVYFGKTKSSGINNIEDLDAFIKINTMINKFEATYNKPFNQLLDEAANSKKIRMIILDFMSFSDSNNVKISKEELEIYSNIEIVHMPKHGFQNLIKTFLDNGRNEKDNKPKF